MRNFKSFSPKVDKNKRLVITRFHSGIKKELNSFCYQVNRITKKGTVDKKFKTLYAFGTDDFNSVKEFKHSGTGEIVKVFKKPFKSVFGVEKNNIESIWKNIK